MKSGKLAHIIEIRENKQTGVSKFGTPILETITKAKLRAEIIQQNTEEFIRDYGASDETIMIFRTRFIKNIKNSDEIIFNKRNYKIKEITENGRRKSLEIRCVEVY